MFEANQYLVERRTWGNRKSNSLRIENISGIVLGYFEPDGMDLAIKDVDGVIQGEVKRLSGMSLALAVYGPQHTYRGTVRLTKLGLNSIVSIPSLYEIKDPQGSLLAILKATTLQRQQHLLKFKSPDGELVANVYPSSDNAFVQVDIMRPGFDPLYALADVTWYLLKGHHS
ncbi:MAG: hypothetical protein LUQ39_06380 [Methanomassiliicoccales archaeon]|nr:hypothetical protein [Methanomassiliicoccales archaeon]